MSLTIRSVLFSMFAGAIILTTSLVSITAFAYTESIVIESKLQEMNAIINEKENEIKFLHARASEDLVFALKNPAFVEYFDLPETKAGNVYDENNVLQFTEQQQKIKGELEYWIRDFQHKFMVDETCIIDASGQEHARLVLSKIAPDNDLSNEESSAPFFYPSFEMKQDEVHVQEPYISPDTNRWVFSYSSPVLLGDEKPAIFHFEMPLEVFQKTLSTNSGNIFIVDKNGNRLIDNNNYSFYDTSETKQDEENLENIHYKDTMVEEFDVSQFDTSNGQIIYQKNNEEYFAVYQYFAPFSWYMVYEVPYSQLLQGDRSLDQLKSGMFLVAGVIASGGIGGAFVLSNKISRPINVLSNVSRKVAGGDLEQTVQLEGSKELEDLSASFNTMVKKIKTNIEGLENEEKVMQFKLDKLEEVEKLKDQFASMVSHELKTPLTPIKGYCEMLNDPELSKNLDKVQTEWVNDIYANASRLELLISDVLDVQKLAMGQMKFNKSKLELTDFFNKMKKDYQSFIKEKNIQLKLPKIENFSLITDEDRLRQVFDNLMKNAVDFVPDEGGIIEIGIKNQGEEIQFYVKDNGTGIPKEKQQHLFKKFYQIDTSRTRKHGGTGLGLVICKGIIEGLGGKITVESDEKGTVFYFSCLST